MPNTYTRAQAMQRLGITARSSFFRLMEQYPGAFKIVEQGTLSRHNPTLYDAQAIDKLAELRAELAQMKNGKDQE